MLKFGLALGLAPGLTACSSSPPSPQGGAQKAASGNPTARYLVGFDLPLAGPLSGFVRSQPPNNPRRTAIDVIPTATSGMDAYYAHGPSLIRYSVWLFPTKFEAGNYSALTGSSYALPIVDYASPASISIHEMQGRTAWGKETAHDRRVYRKYLIARLQKWKAPTDAKTVDAIIVAVHRPITHVMGSGLRVGRFTIVGFAIQDLNAIQTGQAKPSLLLSDEQIRQTLHDAMVLLAQRAQARPEGRG